MFLWKKLKHSVNNIKEWFALIGVFKQLGFVAFIGLVTVLISGFFTGSIKNSYLVFVDPPALALVKDEPFCSLFLFFSYDVWFDRRWIYHLGDELLA